MIVTTSGYFINNVEKYIASAADGETIEITMKSGETLHLKLKEEADHE